MSQPDFIYTVRVYWEDTDAGGVVYYANYLKFFERARTEWLRARGIAQQKLREDTGAIFVVADTSVRYVEPARLDDHLHITVRVIETGRASIKLEQEARRDGGLLATGHIRIGYVDAATFRPRRIPSGILTSTS
jgi:acyl-CoA thioester hydrolase